MVPLLTTIRHHITASNHINLQIALQVQIMNTEICAGAGAKQRLGRGYCQSPGIVNPMAGVRAQVEREGERGRERGRQKWEGGQERDTFIKQGTLLFFCMKNADIKDATLQHMKGVEISCAVVLR